VFLAIKANLVFEKRRQNLGAKNCDLSPKNIRDITSAYLTFQPVERALDANGEAIRVRAQANGDTFGDEGMFTLDDFEVGLAVPAIETGTLELSAATLMQAGFTSRLAAIKAVNDTKAIFQNSHDLKEWLDSDLVKAFSDSFDWPTPESRHLWLEFTREYSPPERSVWRQQDAFIAAKWVDSLDALPEGSRVRLVKNDDRTLILSTAMYVIGEAYSSLIQSPRGVLVAKTTADPKIIALRYYGPEPVAELFA